MLEMTCGDINFEIASLKRRCELLFRENEKLKEMVHKDGLTGLYNFRYLRERLEEEVVRARRHRRNFCLIMIDMDNLKQVNDTYGHQMGNKVIREISNTIRNSVRTIDIVARFGGDEFVVLLPDTDSGSALIIAERISHNIKNLYFLCPGSKNGINVTISAGVVSFDDKEKSADELMHMADMLLYQAKLVGKNCVKFQDSLPLRQAVGLGGILFSIGSKFKRLSR